jgi:hypothetical protein
MATVRFINREVKFYVMTDPGDPTATPAEAPTFTEIPHNSLSISTSAKEADLTTTADAGWQYTLPAERAMVVTLNTKCLYDKTTGDPDAGQAALRTLSNAVGSDATGTFRIEVFGKIRKEFTGWVKVDELGADQNEGAPFNAEIHPMGQITESVISA